ncbi:MAG: FAD-linked oxidase C-terminal domain-containing protein [Bacteroidia bacterium]|nr:FAD-linked oxidase C-terminal domain-containing protein [Bacteroidia bacterium]
MTRIHTDSLHRIAYSTDASVYREVPLGVAYPETAEDVVALLGQARQRHTCLIPRAAGTSIAGQVVGSGIVVDIKAWDKILEVNPEERWARVQPGVVRDELNIRLRQYGLQFSPETSTSDRCCIGGMFGNNSCGTHSLIYGSTRHHVLACKGVLSDGTLFDTERLGEPGYRSARPLLDGALRELEDWAADAATMTLLEANFPDRSLRRRSCGYAIDEAAEEVRERPGLALCKLLAGSEGTLAFITEIKVSLDPLPPAETMAVCAHCDTLAGSFPANLIALRHHPAAVELMDGKILELSRQNIEQERNGFFVEGNPAALLIAEFRGETREEIDARAGAFEAEVLASGPVYTCTRVYGADVSKVWALRKAGLGVLGGMKGDARPVGVIEDTAVAPERLPDYMRDFRAMLERLNTSCVYYGHISTGELHLRPILNLKTAEGRKLFRDIAVETALLVRKHRGSLSGEHGDGRLRGEFIPLMYGEQVYRMMREVKRRWDPDGVFNEGKIIDTPPMDEWLRFTVGQEYKVEEELPRGGTYYNWRAAFDECKVEGVSGVRSQAHAMMCSVEQCNGAGACLKSGLMGGTMCPAYKVSCDETRSTRARANVLREILTRGYESEAFSAVKAGGSVFDIQELSEVLDSCLACKGCLSECPSNVDITRLRSEVLQQKYDRQGTPLRSWLVARMAAVESLGGAVRPLYNFIAGWSLSALLIKKVVRFSAERNIPKLSRFSMRKLVARENRVSRGGRKVYLFADEFTDHQEAELGLTFARLLIRLGYSVEIPRHVESGRAAFSKGCLRLARKYAVRNVGLLSDVISEESPLVGIEPSCILSFRDEYPDIVPAQMRSEARSLARNCLLFDEFIMREVEAGWISPDSFRERPVEIFLHGHCHQKSLVGTGKCADMLRLIPGAKVNIIPSGCCGMAGSFGYEKEHYETSMAIGEMVLFPAVRSAVSGGDVIIAAPGTSCRQQILDGTGVKAVHPIEVLYESLKESI